MEIETLDEHFKYYLENESQFKSTERYVFVSKSKCKSTYSFTYANLLMNICSDFESLIRAYFDKENDEPIEIGEIINLIRNDDKLTLIFSETCQFRNSDYTGLSPLKIIKNRKNDKEYFKWWHANNCIKHNKVKKIFHANQENVLDALGALYILNRYILSILAKEGGKIDSFSNDERLFKLSNLKSKYKPMSELFVSEV